ISDSGTPMDLNSRAIISASGMPFLDGSPPVANILQNSELFLHSKYNRAASKSREYPRVGVVTKSDLAHLTEPAPSNTIQFLVFQATSSALLLVCRPLSAI